MGNAASVNLEEDTKRLEITEKLVRDFQYHINLVDHSMTSFARSIDSLRTSCATLQQCRNENKDSNLKDTSVGEDEDVIECTRGTLLLETIDEVVSDHKFLVMESLSRLFSFIIEIGDSCNIPKPDTKFSVDKYRDKSNVARFGKEVHYCDARFESMQKKLKAVNTAYQIAKNDVENFNSREEIYQKESWLLKNKIKDRETLLAKVKLENEELINQKNVLEVKKEEYSREIYTLKEHAKQMKLELSSEISSKKKIEEKNKIEIQNCFKQIETYEREEKHRLASIDDMQREIESLKKKNESVCTDLKNDRHKVTILKEENTSRVNSLNNMVDKLTAGSIYVKQLHDREIKRLETLLETEQEKHREEIDHLRLECEKLIKDKEDKQTEMKEKESKTDLLISEAMAKINNSDEQLSVSVRLLKEEVKIMNTELKKQHQTEITRLTECLEQAKLAETEYLKTLNVLKEKLQRCDEEKKSSLMQVCHLEQETKRLTADVKEKETEKEKSEQAHKEEIDSCLKKIQKLKQKNREHIETNETLKTEIDSLNYTKMELSSQLQKESATTVSLTEENVSIIRSIQDDISRMSQESTELKQMQTKEKQVLEESIKKEIKEKEALAKINKELNEKQDRFQEENNQLTITKENMTRDIAEKKEQIYSLQLQLELATRKVINVQIVYQSGFRAAKIEEELKRMLKVKMVPLNIDLQFRDCSKSFIVVSDMPLLIVCSRNYSYSRDRNISFVTKGLKEHKMTALLIFHERDERAFLREVTDSRSTDSKLRAIFDIGYLKQEMFDNETNSANIESIIQFIMTVVAQKQSKDYGSAV